MTKTLCTIGSKYTIEAKKILKTIGTIDCLDLTQDELIKKIFQYNILVVGLGLNINEQVIRAGKNLKVIATATTGLDHIDIRLAAKKGIKIISLKNETEFLNTITGTAELAFGLMIDILRMTHPAIESVKNYRWDREKFRGHNLRSQTLGIIGLGRLGTMMARFGNAFYMNVLAYDPHINDKIFNKFKAKKTDMDTLLSKSDAISIHVHLNSETENMFNCSSLSKMKKNAILINTARGKIVNETDLLQALKNKTIAGYATDVLADELNFNQNFSNHPLVEYAKNNHNCIIVPHIGGMTYESRQATDIFIAEKIKKELT